MCMLCVCMCVVFVCVCKYVYVHTFNSVNKKYTNSLLKNLNFNFIDAK